VLLVAGLARLIWPPSSPDDCVEVSSRPDTVPVALTANGVVMPVEFMLASVVNVFELLNLKEPPTVPPIPTSKYMLVNTLE
jgi:hypothetical protein